MSLLSIHKMLFTTLLLLLPFADLISAGPVPANIAKTLGLKLSPGAAILSPSDGAIFVNHSSRFSEFHTATAAVVVSIANELDVVTTVRYAYQNNVTFLTQNRGHGWDMELGQVQNALFLDVQALSSVKVDPIANRVTVGGGVAIQCLIDELYKHKKQIPTTVCYCPGVVGATLGGGVGRLMGMQGLMLDNVISLRVVLADGTLKHVSEFENPDLFWAMRGAGHNFGVVTEITFKIYDQVQNGLHLNLDMIFPPDQVEKLFEVANELAPVMAPEVAFAIVYSAIETAAAPEPIILVNWVYAGPAHLGLAAAQKFLDLNPIIADNTSYPWNELAQKGVEKAVVEFCIRGGRKNIYTLGLKRYDPGVQREIWDDYVQLLQDYPGTANTSVLFQSYAQQAVKAVDPATTAYAHRDVNTTLLLDAWYTDPALDAPVSAWGEALRSKMDRVSGFGDTQHVYINFGHGDESLEAKYGAEAWRIEKLRTLKRKYDPRGVFNGYHPIK